jgi:hypothetical protein
MRMKLQDEELSNLGNLGKRTREFTMGKSLRVRGMMSRQGGPISAMSPSSAMNR